MLFQTLSYKNGVGAPVLKGSFGAIVFGRRGSGGGIKSFNQYESSLKYEINKKFIEVWNWKMAFS